MSKRQEKHIFKIVLLKELLLQLELRKTETNEQTEVVEYVQGRLADWIAAMEKKL